MRSIALMLLAPAVALAAPVRLLIIGGGATPEDGKRAADGYQPLVTIVPAAGFPKVVESATVKGLKPGFHVAVLGACTDDDGVRALEVLRQKAPGAYFRTAEWPDPLPCPAVGSLYKFTELAAAGPLHAFGFGIPDRDPQQVVIEARDEKGALLELRGPDLEKAAKQGPPRPLGTRVTKVTAEDGKLVVDYTVESKGCMETDQQQVLQRIAFDKAKAKFTETWELGRFTKGSCL